MSRVCCAGVIRIADLLIFMPREIVTIQAGQCGNQLGYECWNRLLNEHGIDQNGTAGTADLCDRRDIMFYESDSGEYVPRAILFDLEPRVINSIKSGPNGKVFNPESMWMSSEGGGAGNIWASGFSQAESAIEELTDIINREVELCDSMECFQLLHSMAGGTGSGLGSFLLEHLRELFPKKLLITYSVLPLLDRSLSDVVVQPYNAVLSLARLVECCDGCFMLENTCLNHLATEKQRLDRPSFAHTNYLVATVMATMTSPIRFPSYTHNSLTSVLSNLVPVPSMHMLASSIAPLETMKSATTDAAQGGAAYVRKTNVYDVLRRTFQLSNFMVGLPPKSGDFIAAMSMIRGRPERREVVQALQKLNVQMLSVGIGGGLSNVVITKQSPVIKNQSRVSGLVIGHHSAIHNVLRSCAKQFDILLKRQAFLDNYRRENMFNEDLGEFERSRDILQTLIDNYENFC